LLRSKQRKGDLFFRRKDMPEFDLKTHLFISGQNMWSKWNFGVFLKKLKSPETRLFQGFFENFEGKIFGLVNAVSRSVLQRFFV
jgi:hypothetical protein